MYQHTKCISFSLDPTIQGKYQCSQFREEKIEGKIGLWETGPLSPTSHWTGIRSWVSPLRFYTAATMQRVAKKKESQRVRHDWATELNRTMHSACACNFFRSPIYRTCSSYATELWMTHTCEMHWDSASEVYHSDYFLYCKQNAVALLSSGAKVLFLLILSFRELYLSSFSIIYHHLVSFII